MKFPEKCPYCGKDIVQSRVELTEYAHDYHYNNTDVHKCIHCKKAFTIVQIGDTRNKYPNYTIVCPPTEPISIPERVKKLSPNSYKILLQTIFAKNSNFDTLIGAGLRMSLEWLVSDYLTKIKGYTQEKLDTMWLNERIKKMQTNDNIQTCAKLIKEFGNSSIHIINQVNFSFDTALDAFIQLCNFIDIELHSQEIQALAKQCEINNKLKQDKKKPTNH